MNLESFKSEYKILLDQEEFSADPSLTKADKQWFQYIPCKYGKIYLQGITSKMLQYFSNSKEFAKKFNKEFPKKTNIVIETDDNHCVVEFKMKDRKEVFGFLKAKKRTKKKSGKRNV